MAGLSFPIGPGGLTLSALVGLNQADTTTLLTAGQQVPRPVWGAALIDTGCDLTSVALDVLRRLGLTATRRVRTQTASGPVDIDLFDASLSVPPPGGGTSPMLVLPDLT